MKIYVASSWRNPYQPEVVNVLRAQGHEVYDFRHPEPGNEGFAWSQIDLNWENWTTEEYKKALQHPIAEQGFDSDYTNLITSNLVVLVLPCGRSAHLEAGHATGYGIKVIVYSPVKQEPELMYKMCEGIVSTLDELVKAIKEL